MQIFPIRPDNASIALVGEFPHMQDLQSGQPFIGGSGFELTKLLAEADINKEHTFRTMVMDKNVVGGRLETLIATKKKYITPRHVLFQGKMVVPELVIAAERLRTELLQARPNVVCAIGNLALFVLTGEWGVNDWRSSVMESTLIPGLKVIPTLNPSILFAQWSKRPLIVHDLKRVQRESSSSSISRTPYAFVIRPTFEQAMSTLQMLIDKAEDALMQNTLLDLGGDIETRAGHIACIAFAWSDTEAICIPLMCQHDVAGYWSLDEETDLVMMMRTLMRKVNLVGQNWNYDAQYIYRYWGFKCPQVEDTMIQQHSCFSALPKNLSFLSSMYLTDHLHWKDDRTNWTTGPEGEGEDKYWIYNCTDSVRTLSISKVLRSVVKGMGMEEINTFQQYLATKVLKTMIRGVRVDNASREALSLTLIEESIARTDWLTDVLGHEVNIKSPKQMAELFYGELGQKVLRKRNAEGGLSETTNDEALHKIAAREPIMLPLTRKIAELRSLGVFHSTFVQAPLDTDGRIRTSFNVCGTETYRFASSKNAFGSGLNCQNIPKGGETEDGGLELPNVRKLFIPDAGHTIFDIDLDSADLRIVTWESNCAWMKEQFKADRKPYIEIMKEYYHDQSMSKKSHPREYAMFKSLCHGTNYLGTADGIAPRIGLLVHETERIQKWYFGLCP